MNQTSDLSTFDKTNKLHQDSNPTEITHLPNKLPKLNLTRVVSPQIQKSNEHLKQLLSLQSSMRDRNNSTSSKDSF